jgi:hypothetical protein
VPPPPHATNIWTDRRPRKNLSGIFFREFPFDTSTSIVTMRMNPEDPLVVPAPGTSEGRFRERFRSSDYSSFVDLPRHVPIVPMRVKIPLAPSMRYIETLFEPEFVT